MEKENRKTVQDLSLEFSIHLLDSLSKGSNNKSLLSPNQLIRSGTAIGAMIREAQGAESRKDFIHKMKIAFKEAEETEYWLILYGTNCFLPESDILKDQIQQIKRMLSKIIASSVANSQKT